MKILIMQWPFYFVICHVFVLKCLAMTVNELEDFNNYLIQTSRLDQNLKSNLPFDDIDEDEPVQDHAWETSGKFEGDMILNEKQRRMILTNVAEGLARNGITDSTKRWPNNEVIYFIQLDHFTSGQMEAIQNGIDDLARVSCVKFRPYVKGDQDAVVIQGSRRGCFSQVGYQGGYQVLNLSRRHPAGRGCFRHGTVVHELLHTLGFYHMQSSPDRDDYIDVAWENIIKPARHNFRKYSSSAVSDFGVGYDYDSVLHYSRKAFSTNGQDTIIPKKLGAEIGQRIGLSEKDAQKLNKMYCDADSGLLIEDSSDTPKKLQKILVAENKPFVGHGLGYQQGKTVIIKLPRAEEKQPPNLPEFPVFDYFSKIAQEQRPAFLQDEKEMKTYLFMSPVSTDDDEYKNSFITPFSHSQFYNENLKVESNEQKNEDKDKNTAEDVLPNNEDYTEAFQVADVKPLRESEEDDKSFQGMRLIKESILNKLNPPLKAPSINDIIKNVNNYVTSSPITTDVVMETDDSYFNFGNKNKQKQFDESFLTQTFGEFKPVLLSESYRSLPINRVQYGQDKNKDNRAFPFSDSYNSPLRNKEPITYSYLNKGLINRQLKYKGVPLSHYR